MALLLLLYKMVLTSVGIQEEYTAFDGLKINVMERRTLQIHLGGKRSNNWTERERNPFFICYVEKCLMEDHSPFQSLFSLSAKESKRISSPLVRASQEGHVHLCSENPLPLLTSPYNFPPVPRCLEISGSLFSLEH